MESGDLNLTVLSTQNKQAWDRLYGQVENLVWGRPPIGFLNEFIGFIEIPVSRRFRMLDAGTGEGRNLEPLLSTGSSVTACDASANGLHKIMTPGRLSNPIPCTHCDLSYMPYAAAMFDFVLLADVIETLPDVNSVLREIYRVLKPNGILLCNVPGLEDDISADDMIPLGINKFLYQGNFFYQFLSLIESVNLVERNGFTILRNELRSWSEEAHPGFRRYKHTHTSRVFLVTKA